MTAKTKSKTKKNYSKPSSGFKTHTRKRTNAKKSSKSADSIITVVKSKGDSDGKFVPKYRVTNHEGNAVVYITLDSGQSIILNRNTLSFMDTNIDVKTRSQGGFFSGLKRALFTSSSMFMTKFTATQPKQRVACASFMLGTIIPMSIAPGETYIVADRSLLCFTDNLDLKTRAQFKNIFVSQSLFQVHVTNNSDKPGMLWLTSFGGHTKMHLDSGRRVKIAHGLFLACSSDVPFSVATLKGVKSFFFGTTSTMMEFVGPADIYIHNRNYDYLIGDIMRHVDQPNPQRDVRDNAIEGGLGRVVERGVFRY